MSVLFLCLPAAFLVASVVYSIRAVRRGKSPRRAVVVQLIAFLAVCVLSLAGAQVTASAAADGGKNQTSTSAQAASSSSDRGIVMLAAALATGISGIGSGIAVAASAPAAIGATSEDPKAFGKALIFVALAEGIAIYGLLVSILIINAA